MIQWRNAGQLGRRRRTPYLHSEGSRPLRCSVYSISTPFLHSNHLDTGDLTSSSPSIQLIHIKKRPRPSQAALPYQNTNSLVSILYAQKNKPLFSSPPLSSSEPKPKSQSKPGQALLARYRGTGTISGAPRPLTSFKIHG